MTAPIIIHTADAVLVVRTSIELRTIIRALNDGGVPHTVTYPHLKES